ncbi:MAG: FecR domain-containing protein [Deltaproteobacteria bacterium]|nr:FecR domain-containing protein [Deltaproteobacteria bacterium]
MKSLMKIMLIVCLGLILLSTGANEATAGKLLPNGLTIKADFKPGAGPALGKVVRVVGKAVLIHKGEKTGYTAGPGNFLYKNDTIVTLAGGHLSFSLNDGSFMSLSPETRIMINKSVYSPAKKTRTSFLDMALGKARFVVQKFVDAKHSEFKVKTKTAVAGVRGSDFIIIASADETEIITLSDTILEIISLAAPDAAPAVMNAFEQAIIKKGMRKALVHKVGAQDVERLMKEFLLKPPAVHKEATAIQFTPVVEREVKAPPISVHEEELVTPGQVERRIFNAARHAGGGAAVPSGMKEKIKNEINTNVLNQESEKKIKTDVVHLPDFPDFPHEEPNTGTNG